MADNRADQPTGESAGGPVALTFAELEFVLRSAAERGADVDDVRRRLNFQPGVSTGIVVASGVASLLARDLCHLEEGHLQEGHLQESRVVPGEFIQGAIAALTTRHTSTEAAGWLDERPVVVHLFSGVAGRLAVYPGAYGVFAVELIDAAEPLSAPVLRFLDLCTSGDGAATVLIRTQAGAADESGVAVARSAAGAWFMSDSLERPDPGRPLARAAVVARLLSLLAQPVGV
ncbi:hypothetical protein [Dactylosporangium matsuzakiense]|uniref:Uncharacterized protein n=1 Tax=Dactylosporangium matsuzakiense TaxID=53360 RepID=A0A9W6KNK9_9ACTN|nr:hypothetical protein [Dactylosporangium matsuzakiense]UWZ43261.1 hypothetical protein Dmats_38170 [Dactylosporangium matsuzakiense]GLL02634.1 hypothetical protein GCM10017581_043760 [Dactylosporangium matsuzakiense]